MKKWVLRLLKGENGVTLVELLAVLIILGVLAAIAVPSIGGTVNKSKQRAYVSTLENSISAMQNVVKGSGEPDVSQVKLGGNRINHDTTADLYYFSSDDLRSNNYLSSIPTDVDGTQLTSTGSNRTAPLLLGVSPDGSTFYVAAPDSDTKAQITDTNGSPVTCGVSDYNTNGKWVPLADLTSGTATVQKP